MKKIIHGALAFLLTISIISIGIPASALVTQAPSTPELETPIAESYIRVVSFLEESGIDFDISLESYSELYEESWYFGDILSYEESFMDMIDHKPVIDRPSYPSDDPPVDDPPVDDPPVDDPSDESQLVAAYERVLKYVSDNNIPLSLDYETFLEEYLAFSYANISDYEALYYEIFVPIQKTPRIASQWYENTGTSLPQRANYSKYSLLSSIQKGDVIHEANGGFGLTGHTLIVEGKFYSTRFDQFYVRCIEANLSGVCRGVVDDDRFDKMDETVLRVSGATRTTCTNALKFCKSQLGKPYNLDARHDTSSSSPDWYCSELVWAAYKNNGIDIEGGLGTCRSNSA